VIWRLTGNYAYDVIFCAAAFRAAVNGWKWKSYQLLLSGPKPGFFSARPGTQAAIYVVVLILEKRDDKLRLRPAAQGLLFEQMQELKAKEVTDL
jgi:hypothetical protein